MRYEFNVSGENRKALVKAIADFTGQKAKYNGVPSCSYSIGEITVTKDGALEYEGEEDLADLLRNLADAGFVIEQEAPQCAGELTGGNNTEEADVARQSEPTALTVEIPLDKVKVGNLTNLLDAKGELIKKALGIADLPIEILEDRVAFPWFSEADPESVRAYTHFISALCKMSMDQQRITAKAKEVDNEKYAFRCFLLRLGFIGAEYKAERKVLLKNLSGSSAFKSGQKKRQKTMRFPSKETVERVRAQYPVGCRVILRRMDDVQAPPIGTKGTVTGVDDTASLLVRWDNGSGLNVVYGEDYAERIEE